MIPNYRDLSREVPVPRNANRYQKTSNPVNLVLYTKNGGKMKNYRKIINIILLLTVSSIFVGCAQKITEEQALAEEQAIVEMIQSYSAATNLRTTNLRATTLRATNVLSRMKRRNPNKRLVLLSPNASIRWLRERGYKISRTDHAEYTTRKAPNHNHRGGRSLSRKNVRDNPDFDPQYWQIGKTRIRITGIAITIDQSERRGDILIIYDQYDNLRVITYE